MDLIWSLLSSLWSLLGAFSWLLEPLLKIVFVLLIILTYAPVLTWAERRQSAMMQDRVGPYKAGVFMPAPVMSAIPYATLGALAVSILTGLVLLGCLIAMLLGQADDTLMGLRIGTIFFICLLVSPAHYVAYRVLPTLFDGNYLTAYGLIHPLADVVKMLFKEDFMPPRADKLLFSLAPIIAVIPAFSTFAVIPFGPTVYWEHLLRPLPDGGELGLATVLQVAEINVGILYIFAIAGTGIVGAAIAGYSSDNKYSLLGGLRAASQMVSYEVTLGLSLVGCFMVYDSLLLQDMVAWQMDHVWGIFVQPLAFVMFFTASIAEYKRVPFDVPEGESEIVAGYFLEYSSTKWLMFMTGEFIEVIVSSALIATIFLGGYHVPFLTDHGWEAFGYRFDLAATDSHILQQFHVLSDVLNSHLMVVLTQIGSFLIKIAALCWLSLQVRWTLPRFRYDQIMSLCWKVLLPASLANILITGIVILFFQEL
jgi:NADH-quinone oxidoreductase subunit H